MPSCVANYMHNPEEKKKRINKAEPKIENNALIKLKYIFNLEIEKVF